MPKQPAPAKPKKPKALHPKVHTEMQARVSDGQPHVKATHSQHLKRWGL